MNSQRSFVRSFVPHALVVGAVIPALATGTSACTPKRVSEAECRQMLSRYIDMTLSSESAHPHLSEHQRKDLRDRAVAARMLEPSYLETQHQCEREVSRGEYACAMAAGNADQWEACIE